MLCLCKLAVLLAHCCLLSLFSLTTSQGQSAGNVDTNTNIASWTTDRTTYQPHELIKATVTFQQPIPAIQA